MNSVQQRYNKVHDITKIWYHIYSKRGNWMTDLIKMYNAKGGGNPNPLHPVHNGIIIDLPYRLFKECNHKDITIKSIDMRLTDWGDINTTIDIHYNKKGIHFKNNWENIDTVKRMSKIVSFILNKIKEDPNIILSKEPMPCTEQHAWLVNLTLNDLKL